MYVNPFWFGVFVTLAAEVAGLFVYAVVASRKGEKK